MSAGIDQQEVRRIARLARLALDDDEVAAFARQLTQIIEYVGQLEELDLKGVEPLYHPTGLEDVLRDDTPRDGLSRQQALANAPEVIEGCFRVPAVLDRQGGGA